MVAKKVLTEEQKEARRAAQRRYRAKHKDRSDDKGKVLLHTYLPTVTVHTISHYADEYSLDKWEFIALCIAKVGKEIIAADHAKKMNRLVPGDASNDFSKIVQHWKALNDLEYSDVLGRLESACCSDADNLIERLKKKSASKKDVAITK